VGWAGLVSAGGSPGGGSPSGGGASADAGVSGSVPVFRFTGCIPGFCSSDVGRSHAAKITTARSIIIINKNFIIFFKSLLICQCNDAWQLIPGEKFK
jgi:hypothetical protein